MNVAATIDRLKQVGYLKYVPSSEVDELRAQLTDEMRRHLSAPALALDRDWMPYPSTDVRLSE